MTYDVELPALDGQQALGFLAALGVLRLLSEGDHSDVRLRFDDQSATAILTSPYANIDAVAEALAQLVPPAGAAIPGLPPGFPQERGGTSDPMRVPRAEFKAEWRSYSEPVRQWAAVLLTDLALDSSGRVALTPYTAPSGQQILRTFFEKPTTAVRADKSLIRQALAEWRRVVGFTGEYLDHRVLQSTADDILGQKGREYGVPGATWLAIMALPMLRLTGRSGTVAATLWHRPSGRREPVMIWPLWHRPLDRHAVQALLEHPEFRPSVVDGRITVRRDELDPLGVFIVCAAERQRIQRRNFAGVLAPVSVTLARQRPAAEPRSVAVLGGSARP